MLLKTLLHDLLRGTNDYWYAWIRRSTYDGSWKEAVHRSALALKLLIYEPTGSVLMPDIDDDLTTRVQGLWLLAQPSVCPNSLVGQETGAPYCFFYLAPTPQPGLI